VSAGFIAPQRLKLRILGASLTLCIGRQSSFLADGSFLGTLVWKLM